MDSFRPVVFPPVPRWRVSIVLRRASVTRRRFSWIKLLLMFSLRVQLPPPPTLYLPGADSITQEFQCCICYHRLIADKVFDTRQGSG